MRNQNGFTLIELVVVIVILGILAAVAVPKFIDMREEASQAAVDGVAGSIASAMAINYAGCSVKDNAVTPGKCVAIPQAACTNAVANSLLMEDLSTGYAVSEATAAADANNGTTAVCTLTLDTTYTANFTAIVAGQ